MTTTKTEPPIRSLPDLLDIEESIRSQKTALEADLRDSAIERRKATAAIDSTVAKPLRESLAEATALLAKREQEAELAKEAHRRLEARLSIGDDTVTASDLTAAETAIKRCELLVPPAKTAAEKAHRLVRPFDADNHLAYLAADALESTTPVPVLVLKRSIDAPDVANAVVLSQTEPTSNYGTLNACGSVKVVVLGEAEVEWAHVEQTLRDQGCEVSASASGITFHKAAWPVPRLSAPEGHAVAKFAAAFALAWHALIETNHDAVRLSQAGYTVSQRSYATGLDALSKRAGDHLVFDNGTATGTAKFVLGLRRHGGGSAFDHRDLTVEVEGLVKTFAAKSVGTVTEAGRVTAIALVRSERSDGAAWDGPTTFGVSGHALYPVTIEVEVQVTYEYEQATVTVND
ncbi:MAG: hypothetical protein NTX33_19935 [Propionibacteriales bacterium]|nr:hypothetical protein [Propionibacteriales bacterium]